MKIVPAMFALLLACCITNSASAQNSSNFKLLISKGNLAALNFVQNIFLIPYKSGKALGSAEKNNHNESSRDVIENFSAKLFKYAMMMDVDVESLGNAPLYNFIDEWYGTHYRMGGTTKKGIDCSAFTGTLLSSVFSLCVPRTANEQYKVCEHIKKEDLLPGDLVFFNTRGGVSHVGVYLTKNYFVHSSSSGGVKISSLDDEYYSKKFIIGGRVNQ